MRAVVFSARARRDLNDAWEYIARDDVPAADELCGRVERAVQLLGEMPGAGHTRPDVRDRRYRFWTVKPYVIVYRYTSRTVTIVRILHGARELGAILDRRHGRNS